MYSDAIPPADSMISFQKRVNELKDRGKNLADYEIQHTKTGFQLRNRNSFLTKISKFLHPEQYNLAKNVQELALGATHHASNVDQAALHKALTTILTKQIKDASNEQWKITKTALNTLVTDFIEKQETRINLLNNKLGSFADDLGNKNTPLHLTFEEHLQPIRDELQFHKTQPAGHPELEKLIKKQQKAIFEAMLTQLAQRDPLPYYQYEQITKDLHLLNADFMELLQGRELPPIVTQCFEQLEALRSAAFAPARQVIQEMEQLTRTFQDPAQDPVRLCLEQCPRIQRALAALPEKERTRLQADPTFQAARDTFFTLWLTRTIPGTPIPGEVPLERLQGKQAALPPFNVANQDSLYQYTHGIAEEWFKFFPDGQAVINTLGREDIRAITINGKPMEDAVRIFDAVTQSENQPFLGFALVALTAEALQNELKAAYPKKSAEEIKKMVVQLLSIAPIEHNPVSALSNTLEHFQNAAIPLGTSTFLMTSGKVSGDQPESRFAFQMGQGEGVPCALTVQRNYKVANTDSGDVRFLGIKAESSIPFGGASFATRMTVQEGNLP